MAKLTINEANDPIGVVASETGRRCSDKGFLAMTSESYFELLDWTARQVVPSRRGSTPKETPPVLKRLGLLASSWCELVTNFEDAFAMSPGDVIVSMHHEATARDVASEFAAWQGSFSPRQANLIRLSRPTSE